MKHELSALVLTLALVTPALASAQEIGAKGDAIFSVDRLMGITGSHYRGEEPANVQEDDWLSLSFGWRGSLNTLTPFNTPRFAFDYLVIDHLSVGGSLGIDSVAEDDNNIDFTFFEISPRVGYLYSFGKVVAIW